MTVELWLGREYDHTQAVDDTAEMKALGQFLARMAEFYDQARNLYLIVANSL